MRYEPLPLLPLRACELCDHGVTVDAVRHCMCPAVVPAEQLGAGMPVHIVRATSGACGIEARHMSTPWLQAA